MPSSVNLHELNIKNCSDCCRRCARVSAGREPPALRLPAGVAAVPRPAGRQGRPPSRPGPRCSSLHAQRWAAIRQYNLKQHGAAAPGAPGAVYVRL
jgi:hypothetical protein